MSGLQPNRLAIVAASVALVLTGCAVESTGSAPPGEDITLGWLLPQTGPIAGLGPPQIAALDLAAADISEAGGVNGSKIAFTGGDEAGDPAAAGQAVDRLVARGVPAIVGAGSSAISLSVIDKITGGKIVECSGMNTSPALSDYPDGGYYFRTVPSDVLQGAVVAKRVAADGAKTVAIIARGDSYGSGIADAAQAAAVTAGLQVVKRVNYDPNAQNLDGEIRAVASAGADAIVIFSFDEAARILTGLIQDGAGPGKVKLYGTDAMSIASLAKTVDPSNPAVLQGMTFTQASSGEGSAFTKRLLEANPNLGTTAFTPYFYDCAVLISLAMEEADSTDPTVFVEKIVPLTNGKTECRSFADCKKLIDDGTDVKYVGAAGPLDFSDKGEPTTGLYDILVMGADGATKTVDTVRETQA